MIRGLDPKTGPSADEQQPQEGRQKLLPVGSWWALISALSLGVILVTFYPNIEPEHSKLSPIQRDIQSERPLDAASEETKDAEDISDESLELSPTFED